MKRKDLRGPMMIRSFAVLVAAMFMATATYAQGTYTVSSGDVLQVEVLEDPNLNRTVLVLPDGSISFPLVGTIQAGGRTINAVRSSLTSALAPNFNTPPTVFVSIASLAQQPVAAPAAPATIDVFIMGEVGAPGKIAASPNTTILQLLAEAGGLTRFAAPKRIELRRKNDETGTVQRYIYNYTRSGGGKSIKGSTVLIPGDVVVVPQRRLFE